MYELVDNVPQNAVIKVIGVGGGGGNAPNQGYGGGYAGNGPGVANTGGGGMVAPGGSGVVIIKYPDAYTRI